MPTNTKQNLFFLLFSILFFSTTEPFTYAGIGIDPSWTESLVMTINQGLTFGKDFIFNYGPLGFLNTTLLPERISPFVLFIFHLFLLVNYLFIIKLTFLKMGSNWWKAAIVSVVILLPWGFFADVTFTLFYLMLFWLLFVHHTRNTLGLALAVVLAILIFYIKVNLSLIAYSVLILSLIYFVISKSVSWKTSLLIIGLLTLATYGFSILLNVNIQAYLAGSLKIIDAYQDGQAVNILRPKEILVLVGMEMLILGVVLYFIFKSRRSFLRNLFLYLISALAWFLCFKQAHTATGHYNVFGFFLFLPVLALLVFLFAKDFKNGSKMVFAVLVLQLISTQFIRLSMGNYNLNNYALSFFPNHIANEIKSKRSPAVAFKTFLYKSPVNYFAKLARYDYQNNFKQEGINELRKLPNETLNHIGNATVDIVPWEISYVFLNQFNYNPRPIIQTYQANSNWLAYKNEEKYFSQAAPDFVLANTHPYREQNPIWMDKGVYLALAKNYSLIDSIEMPNENLFLFERRKPDASNIYETIGRSSANLEEPISIPNGEFIYLSADVEYSIFGKIARLFFQPPYLRCRVTYEDGTTENFRIPPPILKGGILASQKVTTEDDFLRFVTHAKNTNVKSLSFWSKYKWGFKPEFKYSLQKTEY